MELIRFFDASGQPVVYKPIMTPRGENQWFGKPSPGVWRKMMCLCAGYFVSACLGSFLSRGGGTMVSYWLPGGLFVAALLLNDTRDWPWLMLSIIPANALFEVVHDPPPVNAFVILLFCATNILQGGTGAWLVRRFVAEKPLMTSLKQFFGLLFFSGVLGSAIGALIAAAMAIGFHLGIGTFAEHCQTIWGGDVMSVLVVTPMILVYFGGPWKTTPGFFTIWTTLEILAVFGGLAALSWHLFVDGGGVNSPKAPLLGLVLWAGLRFGLRGGTLAVFFLAVWSAFLTTHYLQGLSESEVASGQYVFTLQIFVAVAALVGLVPAIILGERDRTLAKLRESEEKFSKAFGASPSGMSISDLETGRFIEVNDGYRKLYGYSLDEMLGRTSVELGIWENAGDRERFLKTLRQNGTVRDLEIRTRTRTGDLKIVHVSAERIDLEGRASLVSALHDVTARIQAEQAGQSQMQVLEMIASGQPMSQTLDALLRMIESQSPDMLCSILLLDAGGTHVRHVAAPSLPAEYLNAIDGFAIGPCAGSCGTAAFRKEPVFVPDIATDPLWAGYKQFALPHGLRACWSTPIFDPQKKVLGTFAVYHRQPGLPGERHRRLISMVTHTAAICINRHRTEAEREQALAREQQSAIEYTLQLIASQEAERKRIAAELHDSMGQNLLLIKNLAEMAMRSPTPGVAYDHLGTINQLAVQCIAEARQISRDLRPYQLDHLGLVRALEAMLEHSAQASNVQFSSKFEPVDGLFSAEAALNLYRVVQESVNNILKHSRAAHVNILLERDIHEVLLRIEDDGVGFVADKTGNKKGLGLKNITERVRMLGGKLSIISAPGHGTRIEVAIPIAEKPG